MASGPPWQRRDPDAFAQLVRDVGREFPTLHFEDRGGLLVLAGEIQVCDAGRVLDLYEIEVEIPHGGPAEGLPVVREVGGKIPRTPDRHVNPDGTACLAVPDDLWYRHPQGFGLLEFLRGPVYGYYVGQSVVANGDPWPFGERAHGAAGVVEFYAPLFRTANPLLAHRLLTQAVAKKMRTHRRCPCGSGRPLRWCHYGILARLRHRLPRSVRRAAASAVATMLPRATTRL